MRSKKILPVVLAVLLSTSMIGVGASQVKAADSATSKSSTAVFKINEGSGKLTLDTVPGFNFGTVDPADIYAQQTVTGSGSNGLQITDTRLNATGWNLSVSSTTAFTNNTSKINGNVTFTPGAFSFSTSSASGWTGSESTLTMPSSSASAIASSTGTGKGTGSASVDSAKLKFTGNNTLVAGTYTSTLTWNLGTATAESLMASD